MLDISSLTKPGDPAFAVDIVFARNGEVLAGHAHPYQEILVLTEGTITLERSDCTEPDLHVATECIVIPPGIAHQIRIHATPTRLAILHPQKQT